MNDYQKNLNPELQDEIIEAAKNGDILGMRALIKKGADPFENNWAGYSAIYYLGQSNPPDIFDIVKDLARFAYKYRK